MPHLHFASNIPKILSLYYLYDRKLIAEFGSGFSYSNIGSMVSFIEVFKDPKIVAAPQRQWSCTIGIVDNSFSIKFVGNKTVGRILSLYW